MVPVLGIFTISVPSRKPLSDPAANRSPVDTVCPSGHDQSTHQWRDAHPANWLGQRWHRAELLNDAHKATRVWSGMALHQALC